MKKFCNLTQEQAIARFNSIFAGTISYNLHINLHKGKNYDGHLEMEFNAKNPDSIFLEYLGNNFRYEHINQQQVPLQDDSHEYLRDNGYLKIPTDLLFYGSENKNYLKINFDNSYHTDGWGIHSNIDIDGTQYIYTQNVPHYFSKICPVFDQPDLKAR
jgi:aminopeptidase N